MANETQPHSVDFDVISAKPTVRRVTLADGSHWDVSIVLAVHSVADKGKKLPDGTPDLDLRVTPAMDARRAKT